MNFLATTFSPMMIASGNAHVRPCSLREIRRRARGARSAVGHENTARLLTELLDHPVGFNRVNLELTQGDNLLVVTPCFRVSEAREFTDAELMASNWRCFSVRIR